MNAAWGYIFSAVVTGIFAIIVVVMQIRATKATKLVHEEVRTNHGIRQGQRIEDLGEDVAFIRRTMVTKTEMAEHTEQDHAFQQRVEPFLVAQN